MVISGDRMENIVGKGENISYQRFLMKLLWKKELPVVSN